MSYCSQYIPKPLGRFGRWRTLLIYDYLQRVHGGDISHFPKWARRLLSKYESFKFDRISFPIIQRVKDTRIFKHMGEWWCETYYHEPETFPQINTLDIVEVQPLRGSCGLVFHMNYTGADGQVKTA
jgi:hypothetical protein